MSKGGLCDKLLAMQFIQFKRLLMHTYLDITNVRIDIRIIRYGANDAVFERMNGTSIDTNIGLIHLK